MVKLFWHLNQTWAKANLGRQKLKTHLQLEQAIRVLQAGQGGWEGSPAGGPARLGQIPPSLQIGRINQGSTPGIWAEPRSNHNLRPRTPNYARSGEEPRHQ